jgi:hypothetical protein
MERGRPAWVIHVFGVSLLRRGMADARQRAGS